MVWEFSRVVTHDDDIRVGHRFVGAVAEQPADVGNTVFEEGAVRLAGASEVAGDGQRLNALDDG